MGDEQAFDHLRAAVRHNAQLITELFEAHRRCDPDALRDLLERLDSNNADLHVALDMLSGNHPPTPPSSRENGGDGSAGRSS